MNQEKMVGGGGPVVKVTHLQVKILCTNYIRLGVKISCVQANWISKGYKSFLYSHCSTGDRE